MRETKRGALKQNATAVARIRVGKTSGSQIGAQARPADGLGFENDIDPTFGDRRIV